MRGRGAVRRGRCRSLRIQGSRARASSPSWSASIASRGRRWYSCDSAAPARYRLLEPRYRFTRAARAAILELPATLAWAREHGLEVSGVELLLVALLAGQPSDIAVAALRRLELAGEPLARVTRTMHGSADVLRALAKAGRPSDRARALRGRSALELVWLWLEGKPGAREQVEWFCEAGSARASLRGNDVIALGVPAGPGVAAALDALRDACLDGVVSGRSAEEAFVRAWGRESVEQVFRKEP